MKQEYIIMLLPVIIGLIITLVNNETINNFSEKIELWFRNTYNNLTLKNGWLNKYILKPLFWLVVSFSNWTDSFSNRGLKNGVRIASIIYLILFWITLIIYAFVFVLSILFIYVVIKIILNSNSSYTTSSHNDNSLSNMVGIRGKKIYSGTNWLNEELKGRVDDKGNIYKGTSWLNEDKIGRIDEDGNIYKGTGWLNEEKIGKIDTNGNIIKGTNWFNEEKIGKIDNDGKIYKGTNFFNETQTGSTK